MNEKHYRLMSQIGGGSVALGIIILVTGIVTGILTIINGARLLKNRKEMIF